MSLIDRLLPHPDEPWHDGHRGAGFHDRLRRLLGRRVVIRTLCGTVRGRIVRVRREFVIVRRRKRRRILVRVAAVCTVRSVRRRRRRCRCGCK